MIRRLFIRFLLLLALVFIGVGLAGFKWPMKSLFYLPGETVRVGLRTEGGMVLAMAAFGSKNATCNWGNSSAPWPTSVMIVSDEVAKSILASDKGQIPPGLTAPTVPARIVTERVQIVVCSIPFWWIPAVALFVVFLCSRVRVLRPIRQGIRWTALVLAIALTGLWFASMTWFLSAQIAYSQEGCMSVMANYSRLWVLYDDQYWSQNDVVSALPRSRLQVKECNTKFNSPYPAMLGVRSYTGYFLGWAPLWLLSVLSLSVFGLVTLCDRKRPRLGHCASCGYNLTGNDSGVCPECGGAVDARNARTPK